jgi:hypothetical protein
MALTTLQPQPEPKATPRSTQWCEIGQTSPGKLLFRCTSNRVFAYTSVLNQVSEQIPFVVLLRCDALIPPTFGYGAVWELTPCTGDFQRRRKLCGSRNVLRRHEPGLKDHKKFHQILNYRANGTWSHSRSYFPIREVSYKRLASIKRKTIDRKGKCSGWQEPRRPKPKRNNFTK